MRVAPGVPLGMGGDPEPCTEDTAVNNYICLGRRPGAPKWVPGWYGWRGGAGGVVQFFDKVVDLWLPWGRLWWSCSSWTRLLTCPLLSLLGFVFFFGVKGVGDVLAGFWSRVMTCSSLVSRASVMFLLGFEQG